MAIIIDISGSLWYNKDKYTRKVVTSMFLPNDNIKTTIKDTYLNMPDYKKRRLEDSWAYPFALKIFPA